jgi:hypothetical protein
MFRQDGSCPALLEDMGPGFPYGAVTRSGPPFQTLPVPKTHATGLVRVRSPLLAESRLMSFPPATEMFQFAGFASRTYVFSAGYRLRGGLPHSEIPGSTIARISPGLFAACHVLHRLSVPRHPPDALLSRFKAPHPTANIIAETPGRPALAGRSGGERCPGRGLGPWITRGPPLGWQTFSPGGTQGSAVEDTCRDPPRTDRPANAPGGSRLGHTTRLFTSVHQHSPPAAQQGTRRRQYLLHAA